jgi:hypothetical protein
LVIQAKVRGIITDVKKYRVAYNTFRLEYNGIPGDLIKAADYGIGTSGNGDNKINSSDTESVYAWAHLANANLIAGSSTGVLSAPIEMIVGVNLPRSSFGNGFLFTHIGIHRNCLQTGSGPLFGIINNTNVLQVGSPDLVTNNVACNRIGFLTVAEALGIDKKMDDGEPDMGIVFSANSIDTNVNGNRCVDNNVQGTGGANYDFDETGQDCRMLFKF